MKNYTSLIEDAAAQVRYYDQINLDAAAQYMVPEEFEQLAHDINNASEYLRLIKEEAADYCVWELSQQIDNWGDDLYDAIRHYATSAGFPRQQVDNCVNPQMIMVWHRAMLVDLEMEKCLSSVH